MHSSNNQRKQMTEEVGLYTFKGDRAEATKPRRTEQPRINDQLTTNEKEVQYLHNLKARMAS